VRTHLMYNGFTTRRLISGLALYGGPFLFVIDETRHIALALAYDPKKTMAAYKGSTCGGQKDLVRSSVPAFVCSSILPCLRDERIGVLAQVRLNVSCLKNDT
jgi:hypothetical protein